MKNSSPEKQEMVGCGILLICAAIAAFIILAAIYYYVDPNFFKNFS